MKLMSSKLIIIVLKYILNSSYSLCVLLQKEMCNKNANRKKRGDAHFQIFQRLYNYLVAARCRFSYS